MSALIPVGPLLEQVSRLLESSGIPFMVSGSFASGHHGSARQTRDVDVVIDPSRAQLLAFLDGLPTGALYLDRHAALEALADRSMFNVIDVATGWKIDFVVRKARPFSLEELARRKVAILAGVRVPVATAEDTILTKLEWAKAGGSERQLADVRGILDVQRDTLDVAYIERWSRELGVFEAWTAISRPPT
jgi:hypothetical protein